MSVRLKSVRFFLLFFFKEQKLFISVDVRMKSVTFAILVESKAKKQTRNNKSPKQWLGTTGI